MLDINQQLEDISTLKLPSGPLLTTESDSGFLRLTSDWEDKYAAMPHMFRSLHNATEDHHVTSHGAG
jgi:hypothetical protein